MPELRRRIIGRRSVGAIPRRARSRPASIGRSCTLPPLRAPDFADRLISGREPEEHPRNRAGFDAVDGACDGTLALLGGALMPPKGFKLSQSARDRIREGTRRGRREQLARRRALALVAPRDLERL